MIQKASPTVLRHRSTATFKVGNHVYICFTISEDKAFAEFPLREAKEKNFSFKDPSYGLNSDILSSMIFSNDPEMEMVGGKTDVLQPCSTDQAVCRPATFAYRLLSLDTALQQIQN